MRKLFMLLIAVVISGCGAGSTYEIMTYDNIIAATVEAQKGVDAFNEAVVTETANRQEQLIQAVGNGIRAVAQEQAIDEAAADALADSVVASLRTHLENYAEQERRRARLYEVTTDNLRYIIQVSEQAKKFIIYRSDIGIQWKEYLESSARQAIGSIN